MLNSLIFVSILGNPVIHLNKCLTPPKIDGIISENEWENANLIKDFVETDPVEGKKPDHKTYVYMTYDDDNLYIAFKCFDDVKTIRKNLTKRDEFTNDDKVGVYLNTYNKFQEGYVFMTNPLGIQIDGMIMPPPNVWINLLFDTDWKVKSFIGDSFWSCEFKIPFTSLKFEEKNTQKWIIVFKRIRPRKSVERYAFPFISKNNPSIFAQGAYLIIPERITLRKKKIELIPYLVTYQSGMRGKETYSQDKGNINLGLTCKYKILPNLTLDFALNPDYSNIETDIPQIDVNTPYALYYPEKRPFFMEGSNMVITPINVFYTRMVNRPLYALKLTGKMSGWDLYLLSAYDKNTIYIIPFEEFSLNMPGDKKSIINLLRAKKSVINSESHIGFIIGDREVRRDEFDNGFGRIAGIDTRIRFLKHYTLYYQGIYSITKEPKDSFLFRGFGYKFDNYTDKFDGERFRGYGNYLYFSAAFRNFVVSLGYNGLSPTFRSDIGFIQRNNFKYKWLSIVPWFYPNKCEINKASIGINYSREHNFQDILKKESLSFSPYFEFSFAQSQLSFDIGFKKMRYRGIYFPNLNYANFFLYSAPSKRVRFSINGGTAKTIYYNTLSPAYSIYFNPTIGISLVKLRTFLEINKETLYKERYKDKISSATSASLNLNCQFNLRTSFRLLTTYYTSTKTFGIYPLFTYQITPFTVFYLGANVNTLKEESSYNLKPQNHEVFLKLQYVFNI